MDQQKDRQAIKPAVLHQVTGPAKPTKRKLTKRARLFVQNPRCFWCGILTVLEADQLSAPDAATIDHCYSKLHPERDAANNKALIVLACYGCNHERSKCEGKRKPFVPKLAERLEDARRYDATLARPDTELVAKPAAKVVNVRVIKLRLREIQPSKTGHRS